MWSENHRDKDNINSQIIFYGIETYIPNVRHTKATIAIRKCNDFLQKNKSLSPEPSN